MKHDNAIEFNSLEDLIQQMPNPTAFKNRFKYYKLYLKKELPHFSIEELLKIDKSFHELKKMYEFKEAQLFLAAIEFEMRLNRNK